MDSIDADAIHGAVEAVDTLRTAGEQAQLVDEVLQASDGVVDSNGKGSSAKGGKPASNDYDDDDDEEEEDGESDGKQVTTVHSVLDNQVVGPQYDIDLGRLGNFLLKCGINLVLPFVNGMMMGFGEIFAHELCFRHNWRFARVSPPERMLRRQAKRDAATLPAGGSVLLQ